MIIDTMFEESGDISVWRSDEFKIPLVLKITEEKVDGNAEKSKFIPIDAMNLFALKVSIIQEIIIVSVIEVKIVIIKLNKKDFVSVKNRKKRNAERLTIPSKKRAKVPVNSE